MDDFNNEFGFSKAEWDACIKVLEKLKNQPFNNPDNDNFSALISKVVKVAKKQKAKKEKEKTIDVIKNASIARNALENQSNFAVENEEESYYFTAVKNARKCYSCNSAYNDIHSFYHKLCPTCAGENLWHRFREFDFNGRNVIITGGRVKVGFSTALKLLQMGANVLVTSRFPALAYKNFQLQKGSDLWIDNLKVFGLDLRVISEIERLIWFFNSNFDGLDILINNAAQTIKYPDDYYEPIIKDELNLLESYKGIESISKNYSFSKRNLLDYGKIESADLKLNRFDQPIDFRDKNSWNSQLGEIEPFELIEATLINQISPYILIQSLLPYFKKSAFKERFIINVTSSEGQFSYTNKTKYHPHTNMTKAALNMLTLTSAADLASEGIYMNAVDVGWISTGAIEELRKKQFERGYIPPLDSVDGAARILHPIIDNLENRNVYIGKLLKNYKVENW